MPQPKLSNPFVGQYERELSRMSKRISTYQPDYIVAITRSGPRLLELLSKEDIFTTEATIITEKSLDFMSKNELQNSSVVVFDDIANTGKTIFSVRDKVQRYDCKNINTVCFGYDIETGQIPIDSVQPQLELPTSKRYEIIKSLTQSFSHLNKPYDVDHPIFYSEINRNKINSFEDHPNTYEISTVNERSSGYRKYTFFPNENGGCLNNLLVELIDLEEYIIDIEKVRCYYDSGSQSFAFVPITSFPVKTEKLKTVEVFSESVPDVYNNIMRAAKNQLDEIDTNVHRENDEKMLYRVLWYLVNHIYGIGYQIAYKNIFSRQMSAKKTLKRSDMEYLFGDSLTDVMINGLDRKNKKIKSCLENIVENKQTKGRSRNVSHRSRRDKNQSGIYNGIRDYVKNNVTDRMTYSDQLSSVFEGTQLVIESKRDESLENIKHDVSKRLEREAGLNIFQMKSLLEDSGIDMKEGSDRGYSLALDFLVDTGVAIPIFYNAFPESDNESYLERTYRHGEGALNRMGYSFVMDTVIEELTDYSDGDISRIAMEKIGVMLTDRLHNGRYWGQATTKSIYDFLSGDHLPRELDIAPEYYRHGKVVLIEDLPERKTNFFTDWCEEQDIIARKEDGVQRGPGWKHRHENDINQVESTISSSQVAALESLATLLYDIDKKVDESSSSDYLTALTTCRDRRSYVKSIHAVIELFFVNKKWNVKDSIDKTRDLCEQAQSIDPDDFVDRDLSGIIGALNDAYNKSQKPHQAINEVQNKIQLRDRFKRSDILTDIREYFGNHPNEHYQKSYEQNLKPFLDHINNINERQGTEAEIFEENTVLFGQICIFFSDIYRLSLDVAKKTAKGKTDLRSQFSKLYKNINDFNEVIEDNPDVYYSGILVKDIPKIELSEVEIDCIQKKEFNSEEFQDPDVSIIIIRDLLSQIINVYDKIDGIYSNYFSRKPWNRRLEDIFHEVGTIEANWVGWYDIRDSSNPKNKSSSESLKEELNAELEKLAEELDDGEFKKSDDDEKHIFIRENKSVDIFLREILDTASRHSMYMRMSVCSVPTGEIKMSPYGHIEGTESHVRAVRVGDLLSKKEEEKKKRHYISVTEGAADELWNNNDIPEIITSRYSLVDSKEESVSLKDPDTSIKFVSYELEKNKSNGS